MKKLILILLLFLSISSIAQQCSDEVNSNSILRLKKCLNGNTNSFQTGAVFSYTLSVSVAGDLLTNCTGLTITDQLPNSLEFMGSNDLSGMGILGPTQPIPPNFSAGELLEWSVTNPSLFASNQANNNFQINVDVRFKPGTTCNGTVALNTASIASTNSTLAAHTTSGANNATAIATNGWKINLTGTEERLIPAGASTNFPGKGRAVRYDLHCYRENGNSPVGTFNLENAALNFTPAVGVIGVPADYGAYWPNWLPGNNINPKYISGSSSTTAFRLLPSPLVPGLDVTNIYAGAQTASPYRYQVIVEYPDDLYPIGSCIENTFTLTGQAPSPCNTPIEVSLSATTCLEKAFPKPGPTCEECDVRLVKGASMVNPLPGCLGRYQIQLWNNSDFPLHNFNFSDQFPPEIKIQTILINPSAHFGASNYPNVSLTPNAGICVKNADNTNYSTNIYVGGGQVLTTGLNCTPVSGVFNSGFPSFNNSFPSSVNSVEFQVNGSSTPGLLSISGDELPAGSAVDVWVLFTIADGIAPGTVIENSVEFTSDEHSVTLEGSPKITIGANAEAKLKVKKEICGNTDYNYNPGEIFRYRIKLQNYGSANFDGTLTDLLDPRLEYIGNPNFYVTQADEAGKNPNTYPCQNTGTVPALSTSVTSIGTELTYVLPTIAHNCGNFSQYNANGDNLSWAIPTYYLEFDVKVKERTAPGPIENVATISNSSQTFTSNTVQINVNNYAKLGVLKEARLLNTSSWTQGPLTVSPGSIVEYRLTLNNLGNLDLNNILIGDDLPINGDKNLLTCSPRGTSITGAVTYDGGITGGFIDYGTNISNPNFFGVTCTGMSLVSNGLPSLIPGDKAIKLESPSGFTLAGSHMITYQVKVPNNAQNQESICNDFSIKAGSVGSNGNIGPPVLPISSNTVCLVVEANTPPQDSCPNNIVQNWSFIDGNNGGASASNWSGAYGSPDFRIPAGCGDLGRVGMWGNEAIGEGMQQVFPAGFGFKTGHSYEITMCVKHGNDPSKQNYSRFKLRASNTQLNNPSCTGPNCEQIGITNDITNFNSWTTETFHWIASANYNRLTISVTNDLNVNDGALTSYGLIDKICIRDVTPCKIEIEGLKDMYNPCEENLVFGHAGSTPSGRVNIYLEATDGSISHTIASNTNEDGQVNYNLPDNLPCPEIYYVRIVDIKDTTCFRRVKIKVVCCKNPCSIKFTEIKSTCVNDLNQLIVNWTGTTPSGTVALYLQPPSGPNIPLNNGNTLSASLGTYTWNATTPIPCPATYKVGIVDPKDKVCKDIREVVIECCKKEPCKIQLKTKVQDAYCQGDVINFSWTGIGTSGNIKIDLLTPSLGFVSNIDVGQPQSGTYSYSIPSNFTPCDELYVIRVYDAENPECFALLGKFLIKCCPECKCGQWSNEVIKLKYVLGTNGNLNKPLPGGTTKKVPTSPNTKCGEQLSIKKGTGLSLGFPTFNCNPTTCIASYEWRIVDYNNQSLVLSGTGNIVNYTFNTPGDYVVEKIPICNGEKCKPCVLYVHVENPEIICDCGNWINTEMKYDIKYKVSNPEGLEIKTPNNTKIKINNPNLKKVAEQVAEKTAIANAAKCGATLSLKETAEYTFYAPAYKCKGENCDLIYNWRLINLSTGLSEDGFGPWWLLSFKSGKYRLEIVPICSEKKCKPCTFNINVTK